MRVLPAVWKRTLPYSGQHTQSGSEDGSLCDPKHVGVTIILDRLLILIVSMHGSTMKYSINSSTVGNFKLSNDFASTFRCSTAVCTGLNASVSLSRKMASLRTSSNIPIYM